MPADIRLPVPFDQSEIKARGPLRSERERGGTGSDLVRRVATVRAGLWPVCGHSLMPVASSPACPFQLCDGRLAVLWNHWASLWQRDALPRRAAFNESHLSEIRDIIWLYRIEGAPREFYCELAGDAVRAAWQRVDLLGASISDVFGAQIGRLVTARWLSLVDTPAVMHGSVLSAPSYWEQMQRRTAERIVLPLSHDDGRPYGVIGATSYGDVDTAQTHLSPAGGDAAIIVRVSDLAGSAVRRDRLL